MEVRIELEEGGAVATLTLAKDDCLHALYKALAAAPPSALLPLDQPFCFLHPSGVPIHPQLWPIVPVANLPNPIKLRKGVFDFIRRKPDPKIAVVLHDFLFDAPASPDTPLFLPVREGQSIQVLKYERDSYWWFGRLNDGTQILEGWFPGENVKLS